MIPDLIPVKYISQVRRLGFKGCPTFYNVFKWFRRKWKYTSWIEQVNNQFIYKIYARGSFHRPIHTPTPSPYCSNYEKAQAQLLKELITIVKEIEK